MGKSSNTLHNLAPRTLLTPLLDGPLSLLDVSNWLKSLGYLHWFFPLPGVFSARSSSSLCPRSLFQWPLPWPHFKLGVPCHLLPLHYLKASSQPLSKEHLLISSLQSIVFLVYAPPLTPTPLYIDASFPISRKILFTPLYPVTKSSALHSMSKKSLNELSPGTRAADYL